MLLHSPGFLFIALAKVKVLGYFVGQVMMTTKGRGNPQTIRNYFIEKIEPIMKEN